MFVLFVMIVFLIFMPKKKIMMEKKIKFAENVILIDASYINKVGTDLKEHFEPVVQRSLPKADMALLLECMAMDAGIEGNDNEIQVIFIHEAGLKAMTFCSPAHFADELHDKAFRGVVGEFSLYSFQTSEMAPREELFKESVQLLCESKDVKKMILVPNEFSADLDICSIISKEKIAATTVFGMNPPCTNSNIRFEMIGFALLQAYGIKAEELQ